MDPLRLIIVTRRFWPLVGGAENALGRLAAEMVGRGVCVTILTARWQPEWPARVRFHDVPVVRLMHPPDGRCNTVRYCRALGHWLKRNRDQYDLVYVSQLKEEAYAAMRSVGRSVPVVLRVERAGQDGDCLWQIDSKHGRRIKRACLRAAGFVGASLPVERDLQAAGYPRERIRHIPNGVPIAGPRSQETQSRARSVLAAIQASLCLPSHAPLIVYAGHLHPRHRLKGLVAAFRQIVSRWPNARLWLAGEGPQREKLVRRIQALNLTGRAVPVGVFHGMEDVLAAADLYVSPSPRLEVPTAMLEAMAAGLPIVAADTPGNRSVIDHGEHGLLVPAGNSEAISAAAFRLLDEPDFAARLGIAAQTRAAKDFPLAKTVDQHVTWFESLVHGRPTAVDSSPATAESALGSQP